MTTRKDRVVRRDQLFDYLVDQPTGADKVQMMAALGLTEDKLKLTIRDLRLFCGEFDEINLVCDPNGIRQPWLYKLVGNLEAARGWQKNQMKHLEARLETSLAIANSLVAANPDGRRIEAKKAKKVAKVLGRLIEDLDEIREEV